MVENHRFALQMHLQTAESFRWRSMASAAVAAG